MQEEVVVKGRLKKHNWKEEIKAPDTIISTIESGYVLPLKSQPTPFSKANHTNEYASLYRRVCFNYATVAV